MALVNLVYRDLLFPREAFRHTWDVLNATQSAHHACRRGRRTDDTDDTKSTIADINSIPA